MGWVQTAWLTSSHIGDTVHFSSEGFTFTTWYTGKESSKDLGRSVLAFTDRSGVVDFLSQVGNGCSRQVVGSFTHEGVDEIGTTKSTGDQRVDISTVGSSNPDISTDMGKDILVTHADESEFTKVGMGSKVLTVVSMIRQVTHRVWRALPRSLNASYWSLLFPEFLYLLP
jgi:hypothetical protein